MTYGIQANHAKRHFPVRRRLRDFIRLESVGGILLLAGAVVAMVAANTPLATLYDALLSTPWRCRSER